MRLEESENRCFIGHISANISANGPWFKGYRPYIGHLHLVIGHGRAALSPALFGRPVGKVCGQVWRGGVVAIKLVGIWRVDKGRQGGLGLELE